MKLFLISQDVNDGYNTYDSIVVAAETEDEARVISPSKSYRWDEAKNSWMFQLIDGTEHQDNQCTWVTPDKVKVEYIGEAKPETKAGVILSSFNAG